MNPRIFGGWGLLVLMIAGCLDEPVPPAPAAPASYSADIVPSAATADVARPSVAFANSPPAAVPLPSFQFVDVREEVGLDFVFDTGANGRALMIESTGGGGGWIDFDRDGWPDLCLIQGGNPTTDPAHPVGDRLFRNRLGQFADVTNASRIHDSYHGMGPAVGDFDNDGFDDIFITNIGPNVLWRNLGDGTFADVTSAAGVGDARWGSSAAWADLDLDGDLDLFVCNYLDFDVFDPQECLDDGRPAICHPEQIDPVDNVCYENLGDETFRPVERSWNLLAPGSKSLGVAVADFNGDGLPDIYVANDTTANHLFVQKSRGEFRERAVELGCALNGVGQYQASMGIACGDYDGNGFLDLYVTHFTGDSNTLYANLGTPGFHDATRGVGLHRPTLKFLGFGAVMGDFNADGLQELFVANGHIDDWRGKGDLWKMPAQLFTYQSGKWHEVSNMSGSYFGQAELGRAVAAADFNRDGACDVLVVNQDAPAALLRNDSPTGNWLRIELQGIISNRHGINARVEVQQANRRWVQQLVAGGSYCAAHENSLHFGLGDSDDDCTVTVHWPRAQSATTAGSSKTTVMSGVNRRLTVVETPAAGDRP